MLKKQMSSAPLECLTIPIDHIDPNPHQPRRQFDEKEIAELAESIREVGLIQPIVVRPKNDRWELIAGERRLRALRYLGLSDVQALISHVSKSLSAEQAIVENLQRFDLNPMEVALACQSLIDIFQLTQEQIAVKLGKERSTVANFLRLLKLPAPIQQLLSQNLISMAHAKVILSLKEKKCQQALAQKIVDLSWSVKQAENWVKDNQSEEKQKPKDANLFFLEEKLKERFQVDVKLKGNHESGTVLFSFRSLEELDHLLERWEVSVE